ncbi:MFS transporter [Pseudothauera rhizosphaerae]|uniref:MFS transporter n=1 Tax=Pseudothauera rhizosphaerae TaxID=2565932 RepID=A0A4S4AG27_9RHOO|nr:MFS transporter [Pseudothauera rhizosphaerae]THF58081.1 MFS transporter [Pseudothauera rhizosphaerae]
MRHDGGAGSWGRIFLPFALGYYLSYLLRTVNAVISPALTGELGLSAAELGLLTSTYFLSFALAQIPVGIALDRYGPRRVEGGLLVLTALGAVAFALGDSLGTLGPARALIGLGVSACLMGALKGFAMWYPAERQSSMTGFIMAAGALGALTASAPVEAVLPVLGWRGVFWIVAAIAAGIAAWIFLSLPDEASHGSKDGLAQALRSVAGIYTSRGFLRFAGSAALFTGGFMALQSLWAVPWMMHVNGLTLERAAALLLALNSGMLAGQLGIGVFGVRMARAGVRPVNLLQAGYAGMLAVQVLILLDWGPHAPLWFLLGALSAVNSQTYLAASAYFPREVFARVSTSVNLMAFLGAFAVQWGLGLALDALQAAGHGTAGALTIAFVGLIALQALSYLPLLPASGRRSRN